MRARPSLTARHVAAQRSRLERPAAPTGDPDADRRLEASLGVRFRLPRASGVPMAARTRFFDEQTQTSIERGIGQVVILGAGYDGRALRFAGPDTCFFEVDHPTTQADKRRRLDAVGADTSSIRFVGCDLRTDDLARLLRAAGFDDAAPALFLCEGLLPYLEPAVEERVLTTAATLGAAASGLVVNFQVRPPSSALRVRLARGAVDALLAAIGEPRRSEFAPGDPERLLDASGWRPETIVEADHEERQGYGLMALASNR